MIAEIQSETCAVHSRRIWGAAGIATEGMEAMVIQRGGSWSSDAFIVYVKANMDNARLESTSLVGRIKGTGNRGKGRDG